MKTKHSRKFLLLFSLLMIAISAQALYVEIGDGTSDSNNAPFTNLWDYSWSRAIYLQSEIGMSMDISSVSYDCSSDPEDFTVDSLYCYMKHTTDTEFTDPSYIEDPVAEGFTLCHFGSTTFNGSGWYEFILDTPFEYNGTENLMIMWDCRDGSFGFSGPSFYYTNVANRVVYRHQDTDYPANDGAIGYYLPNTRLHYELVGGPGRPTDPNPENGLTDVAVNLSSVSWTSGDNTTNFDVYFGTENPPSTLIGDNIPASQTSINLPNTLDYMTTYYWKVVARNGAGEVSSDVWSFTTENTTITSFPYETDFETFPPQYWDMSGGTHNWGAYTTGGVSYAYCNFYSWSSGSTAYMTLPNVIVPEAPILSFNWSHQCHSSYPNDALTVQISTNGGTTWNDAWHKAATDFDSNDGAGGYTPGDMSIMAGVDLSAYIGQSVLIRFFGYSGYGNDLFIDNVTVFSNNSAPSPVTPIYPTDTATDVSIIETLQWNSSPFASGYYLYFGTDNPPTDIVNGNDQGSETTYSFSDLDLNATYYWQVVPYNENGNAIDCPVWSFMTQELPRLSEVVSPYDGKFDVSTNCTLEWTAALGASGYKLYLGTDDPPTDTVNGDDLGDVLTYDCSHLELETDYYWQIVPYNENGDAIDCETWEFTTYGLPLSTTAVAPTDGLTDRPETGTLIWNDVSGAEGYKLYFGTDNPPTNLVNGDDLGLTEYFVYSQLNLGTTFYWQIVPFNEAGDAEECPIWSFTTTTVDSDFGGNDGYYFANSMAPNSHPTYRWIDTTGHTELVLDEFDVPDNNTADDGNWVVELPFDFPFFGVDQDTVYVTTNGQLGFTNAWPYLNKLIPDVTEPNDFIAVLWDDFKYYGDDAQIFVGGDASSFTVTYWHFPTLTSLNYYITLQATLFPNGKIIICYNYDESSTCLVDHSGYDYDCSIGIENSDGTIGVQYHGSDVTSAECLNSWVGGPMFDPINGNLALAFGTNQNDLDWPVSGPDAPANLTINANGTDAVLTWEAVPGAASYRIFFCETPDGTFTLLDSTPLTTYTHEGLSNKYFYYVTAQTFSTPTRKRSAVKTISK